MKVFIFNNIYFSRLVLKTRISLQLPKNHARRDHRLLIALFRSQQIRETIIINFFTRIQATFVCTRTESSIPCEESEKYYTLNEEIGKEVEEEEEADQDRGKENVTKVLLVDAETASKKSFPRNARLINRGRRLQ